MRISNCSVLIPQGREHGSGHVALSHGQVFTVKVANLWLRRDLDAEVVVDGKSVGNFRVRHGSTLELERPVHDAGCFTFYKAGTAEATAAGVDALAEDVHGLIEVRFRPEREPRPGQIRTPKLPRQIYDDPVPAEWPPPGVPRPPHRWDDGAVGRFSMSAPPPDGVTGLYAGAVKTQSCGDVPQNDVTLSFAPGGTGLSGHSDQSFVTVGTLDYDPNQAVTVRLRLVEGENGPRPLTAATAPRENPAPAPVG